MGFLLPVVREELDNDRVALTLIETEGLWKRRQPLWPAPFDPELSRRWLNGFFGDPHRELELFATFVGGEPDRFDEIRMLIRYTDEDDWTGLTRWFTWRRTPGAGDRWRCDPPEGNF